MTNEEKIAAIKEHLDPNGYVSFDVAPGWMDLVWNCHREMEDRFPGYKITQVKQKFGGLRFYYSSADPDVARSIVGFYERMSYFVCEICGTTLNVTSDMTTLWDPCRLKRVVGSMKMPETWQPTETN